jgi:uncharacterized HAD superfamily protein
MRNKHWKLNNIILVTKNIPSFSFEIYKTSPKMKIMETHPLSFFYEI